MNTKTREMLVDQMVEATANRFDVNYELLMLRNDGKKENPFVVEVRQRIADHMPISSRDIYNILEWDKKHNIDRT